MNNVVKLSSGCEFNLSQYGEGKADVTLDYVERSSDYWFSDTETSIDIDKEMALKIISLLQAFIFLSEGGSDA